MARPTKIILDLAAACHNLQRVKEIAPGSAVLAMVKANAYGHGLTRIALALSDADAFGVACVEEGLQLREAGVTRPIVLMEGLFQSEELAYVERERFTLVVHHPEQVAMLEKHTQQQPISVWMKINTGMNRLGFDFSQVQTIHQRLMNCKAVSKPIGLMTHFAKADSQDKTITLQQIEKFMAITAHLPGPRSLANSPGILAYPTAHADWVRPGLMLYGASPFAETVGLEYGLQPVMTLSSSLIAVYPAVKGSEIGYGGTWICPEDMLMGVVGIGYGDGYPRHAENGTPVLVNGKVCPLIGRVSMDMLAVDLRSQPNAKVGDPVILWGAGLPVEVIAKHSGTVAYELLTRMTQRVRLVIKNSNK